MTNFKASLILLVGLFGLGSAGCDKIAQARKLAEEAKDATSNDVDYFDDATDIPKQLRKETKRKRAIEIYIYRDRARAQLQDPDIKKHADGYTLRNGRLGEAVPVKWMGSDKPTADEVTETSFEYGDVDFEQVQKLLASAPKDCGEPDGEVSHVLLRRPFPFGGDVEWRVFVEGERGDCQSVYDLEGKLTKTD